MPHAGLHCGLVEMNTRNMPCMPTSTREKSGCCPSWTVPSCPYSYAPTCLLANNFRPAIEQGKTLVMSIILGWVVRMVLSTVCLPCEPVALLGMLTLDRQIRKTVLVGGLDVVVLFLIVGLDVVVLCLLSTLAMAAWMLLVLW